MNYPMIIAVLLFLAVLAAAYLLRLSARYDAVTRGQADPETQDDEFLASIRGRFGRLRDE